MRLIIAGSRHFDEERALRQITHLIPKLAAYLDLPPVTHVITGDASGVDAAASRWAMGKQRPGSATIYEANWAAYGKAAGPIRNGEMAADGDALLLIWDGKSRGSADMLRKALARNLPVFESLPGGAFRVHRPQPAAPAQLAMLEDAHA